MISWCRFVDRVQVRWTLFSIVNKYRFLFNILLVLVLVHNANKLHGWAMFCTFYLHYKSSAHFFQLIRTFLFHYVSFYIQDHSRISIDSLEWVNPIRYCYLLFKSIGCLTQFLININNTVRYPNTIYFYLRSICLPPTPKPP